MRTNCRVNSFKNSANRGKQGPAAVREVLTGAGPASTVFDAGFTGGLPAPPGEMSLVCLSVPFEGLLDGGADDSVSEEELGSPDFTIWDPLRDF